MPQFFLSVTSFREFPRLIYKKFTNYNLIDIQLNIFYYNCNSQIECKVSSTQTTVIKHPIRWPIGIQSTSNFPTRKKAITATSPHINPRDHHLRIDHCIWGTTQRARTREQPVAPPLYLARYPRSDWTGVELLTNQSWNNRWMPKRHWSMASLPIQLVKYKLVKIIMSSVSLSVTVLQFLIPLSLYHYFLL